MNRSDYQVLAFVYPLFLFCFAFGLLSYFLFDRPIVYKMEEIQINRFPIVIWINHIADVIYIFTIIVICFLGIKTAWKSLTYKENWLFITSVTTGVAEYIKSFMKILFGRFWPNTWVMDNLSFTNNQAYGFDFFHLNYPYGSFPSGHATIVACTMTFVWVLIPKWRWAACMIFFLQVFSLIALNYHFLSDVIAGAFFGSFCSLLSLKINSVKHPLSYLN